MVPVDATVSVNDMAQERYCSDTDDDPMWSSIDQLYTEHVHQLGCDPLYKEQVHQLGCNGMMAEHICNDNGSATVGVTQSSDIHMTGDGDRPAGVEVPHSGYDDKATDLIQQTGNDASGGNTTVLGTPIPPVVDGPPVVANISHASHVCDQSCGLRCYVCKASKCRHLINMMMPFKCDRCDAPYTTSIQDKLVGELQSMNDRDVKDAGHMKYANTLAAISSNDYRMKYHENEKEIQRTEGQMQALAAYVAKLKDHQNIMLADPVAIAMVNMQYASVPSGSRVIQCNTCNGVAITKTESDSPICLHCASNVAASDNAVICFKCTSIVSVKSGTNVGIDWCSACGIKYKYSMSDDKVYGATEAAPTLGDAGTYAATYMVQPFAPNTNFTPPVGQLMALGQSTQAQCSKITGESVDAMLRMSVKHIFNELDHSVFTAQSQLVHNIKCLAEAVDIIINGAVKAASQATSRGQYTHIRESANADLRQVARLYQSERVIRINCTEELGHFVVEDA